MEPLWRIGLRKYTFDLHKIIRIWSRNLSLEDIFIFHRLAAWPDLPIKKERVSCSGNGAPASALGHEKTGFGRSIWPVRLDHTASGYSV